MRHSPPEQPLVSLPELALGTAVVKLVTGALLEQKQGNPCPDKFRNLVFPRFLGSATNSSRSCKEGKWDWMTLAIIKISCCPAGFSVTCFFKRFL